MRRHILAVIAYVAAAFATQATSHFVLAADHYATVAHIRQEPIFQLGVLAMLIQGTILSVLYAKLCELRDGTATRALLFSWTMGLFLGSYIALAEAAKYAVPAPATWIAVELAAGLVQFSLFGVLLGLIHRPGPKA